MYVKFKGGKYRDFGRLSILESLFIEKNEGYRYCIWG